MSQDKAPEWAVNAAKEITGSWTAYSAIAPRIALALSQAYERGQESMRERAGHYLKDKAEEMRGGATMTAQTMARIFDDQAEAIRSLPIEQDREEGK